MDDFIKIVEENQVKLRCFIRTLGVHPDSVDDIAQEVFLTAYKKFENFDKTKKVYSWLFGIAKNLANNERRKEARHARILNDNLTEFIVENSADLHETIYQDHLIKIMNNCIEELSDVSRNLLRLRYEKKQKSNEIAKVMCKKAGTIRQALSRIRDALRVCIESKTGTAYERV